MKVRTELGIEVQELITEVVETLFKLRITAEYEKTSQLGEDIRSLLRSAKEEVNTDDINKWSIIEDLLDQWKEKFKKIELGIKVRELITEVVETLFKLRITAEHEKTSQLGEDMRSLLRSAKEEVNIDDINDNEWLIIEGLLGRWDKKFKKEGSLLYLGEEYRENQPPSLMMILIGALADIWVMNGEITADTKEKLNAFISTHKESVKKPESTAPRQVSKRYKS